MSLTVVDEKNCLGDTGFSQYGDQTVGGIPKWAPSHWYCSAQECDFSNVSFFLLTILCLKVPLHSNYILKPGYHYLSPRKEIHRKSYEYYLIETSNNMKACWGEYSVVRLLMRHDTNLRTQGKNRILQVLFSSGRSSWENTYIAGESFWSISWYRSLSRILIH